MDIKNTLELVSVLRVLGECLKKAREDGEMNIWDIPKFAPMISAGRKALEDSEQVKLEIKDLDEEETQQILEALLQAVMALSGAILSTPTDAK